MKSEAVITTELQQTFTRLWGRQAVVIKLADRATAGVPDISISLRRSGWLEIKASEKLGHIEKIKGIQLDTAQRLEFTTRKSWFIIFIETMSGERFTDVVLPSKVKKTTVKGGSYVETLHHWSDFNYLEIASFLVRELT